MDKGSGLNKVLTFKDLTLFGIASIMGSGGFNLIGEAIISGGTQFPVALAAVSTLFQGTSYVYEEVYNEFKTNTAESDLIKREFGTVAANLSSTTILLFNLISVSVILVICSKLLFPSGTWSGQISFALVLLSIMTTASLQGIEFNRDVITLSGLAVTGLLCFATLIGMIELRKGFPTAMPGAIKATPSLIHSILYFYFVLAGFDTLIKFTEESKDPDHDLARSFYASNALSSLLTIGICFAFLVVFSKHVFKENDNIVAKIVGAMLGPEAEKFTGLLSIALMVVTGFVCFLASTRYMFGIGQEKGLDLFTELNEKKAPWKAIIIAMIVIAAGILNNHVYTLVKICDLTLTVTLLLVSAAATKLAFSKGLTPWIEGLTTLGLGGLLSITTLYR